MGEILGTNLVKVDMVDMPSLNEEVTIKRCRKKNF